MTKEEAIKEINDAADEIVRHWAIENPTVKEEAETRIAAFEMAVKMLSDEKTTDDDVNTMRILFNAIIGDLCNQCRHNDAEEMEGIRDRLIKRLLETPKTGRWVATENEEMEIVGFFCSECDLPLETEEKTAYCPHCGSKMEQNEKN